MIKVSVIVPVWNVEKYIDKCLKSLVNQTLNDIEIIVVNDDSPDNSEKIIKKYMKSYPDKIFYYKKENGGQGSARNLGISVARGEYIGFVDSDDYVDLNMYSLMYYKAKSNNYDMVCCGNYVVLEDGNILDRYVPIKKFDNDFDNAFFGQVSICNKIIRKDILIKNKILFKEKVWYEDLPFNVKVITSCKKFAFIDDLLYYYLMRSGSTMNNNNVDRNLEILDAFYDINLYFDKKNIGRKYNSKLTFLAIYHIFITAIVRVINSSCPWKKRMKIVKEMKKYMNDNFSSFKDNEYFNYLDRNKKIVYYLIKYRLYFLVRLIFIIKK